MRVAHLTTVDLSLRFLLYPQLRAVVDAGGEAIGISAPGPWVAGLERDGIQHVSLPSSTRGFDLIADLRASLELWRSLRGLDLDVLHTHNPKPGIYGRIVGRLAGVPIIVNTVHGLYASDRDPMLRKLVVYLLEMVASRFSDAELVQNPEDVTRMLRLHLAPSKHVGYLGNGIDLQRFDPSRTSSEQREHRRRSIGVNRDDILVGTVGRLVREKGHLELFEAFRHLPARYRLVVIGAEDPEKPDAVPPESVEEARRRGAVFLGHQDDVEQWYSAMDIFVLASHREGFPRAAMEAAAMARPIVATDIRGCRQVVEAGRTGFLVPMGEPTSLANAILELGDDAELRARFGATGRTLALARFDERRCVEIVLETYRNVAARKGLALL